MNSSHLATHLEGLTAALDGTGDDIATILGVLVDDLTAAIGSFAGLCVTVPAEGEPFTLIAMNSQPARTSMMLPLRAAAIPAGCHVVFYAANPGAFVDLAADTRIATGLGNQILLDGHLPPPTASATQTSLTWLSRRSAVNQAVGFLIEQGHEPAEAHEELKRLAATAGISVLEMAERLFADASAPDPQPDDDMDERIG